MRDALICRRPSVGPAVGIAAICGSAGEDVIYLWTADEKPRRHCVLVPDTKTAMSRRASLLTDARYLSLFLCFALTPRVRVGGPDCENMEA